MSVKIQLHGFSELKKLLNLMSGNEGRIFVTLTLQICQPLSFYPNLNVFPQKAVNTFAECLKMVLRRSKYWLAEQK